MPHTTNVAWGAIPASPVKRNVERRGSDPAVPASGPMSRAGYGFVPSVTKVALTSLVCVSPSFYSNKARLFQFFRVPGRDGNFLRHAPVLRQPGAEPSRCDIPRVGVRRQHTQFRGRWTGATLRGSQSVVGSRRSLRPRRPSFVVKNGPVDRSRVSCRGPDR